MFEAWLGMIRNPVECLKPATAKLMKELCGDPWPCPRIRNTGRATMLSQLGADGLPSFHVV